MTGTPDDARCRRCGTARDPDDPAAALLWSVEPAEPAPRLLCPDCVRSHARDIEAKLPEQWW